MTPFPAPRKIRMAGMQPGKFPLDEPTRCPDPAQIEIGRDGLILQYNGHSGVFLPQVPVEQGWDRNSISSISVRRPILPQGSWRKPDASLYWYQALVFKVGRSKTGRRRQSPPGVRFLTAQKDTSFLSRDFFNAWKFYPHIAHIS